ncbi:putative dynamin GTPase [Helianthus anomalus]
MIKAQLPSSTAIYHLPNSNNSNNPSSSRSMTSTVDDNTYSSFKARFAACNPLQAAAVAFGQKLPIPEIVAIGGQSDGKSSLLEAFLGFRFNVREVGLGSL